MAGERLYRMMHERGGSDNEYCDIVYGTVDSVDPLKVQLANDMILTDDFIVLGKNIGKIVLNGRVKVYAHSDKVGSASGNRPELIEKVRYELDNSLKAGDKVSMIRADGGQQFYLFEREPNKPLKLE
ncbi:DUF2577 domain-containing protein [Lactobacillus sp. ESL0731]|uniref:DUF2577 domain-containing protein n=1 Tax=unclassified Lactobacillus TaxID=2620435 RepID=UPI0023F9DDCE|nr:MULTISPECIES: DUF2577 domain-containing protein [unclassified Lactobacillus]WEV51681.1 DUF2577 domain-containing protein [Lactobacillus sp. ESL0700]WEV62810.1 DUF2577 domain-containing protein [Lactobacillus sp. ESL0731]